MSQVDLLASFGSFLKLKEAVQGPADSENQWNALIGKDAKGRGYLVEHANGLALVRGKWKYIEPKVGPKLFKEVNIESGYDTVPQLYDLEKDPGAGKCCRKKFGNFERDGGDVGAGTQIEMTSPPRDVISSRPFNQTTV